MDDTIKKLPKVTQFNIHSTAYLTFLELEGMPLEVKFIWLHLDARAGTNRYLWFGKERIYNTIGMSKNTYAKYIKELEKLGGIIRLKRFDSTHGDKQTDIIIVCEFNQIEKKFIIPPNINEIYESINIKFNTSVLVKAGDQKTKTSKSVENKPKSKICAKVQNAKSIDIQPKSKICAKVMSKICALVKFKKWEKVSPKICALIKESSINNRKVSNKRKKENNTSLLSNNLDNFFNSIKTEMSEVSFKTWIEPLEIKQEENKIQVVTASDFTKTMIKNKFIKLIEIHLKKYFEFDSIEVVCADKLQANA